MAQPMPSFQKYPVYVNQPQGVIYYDGPQPPRMEEHGHPFPPYPMYINNDFNEPPPPQMNYYPPPQDGPPRRGGFGKRGRGGQRGPPPGRGGYNPTPRRGRKSDPMDEMNFFRDSDDEDDDDLLSGFDPMAGNPRLYTKEELENGGARQLIDNIRQQGRQGVQPAKQQSNLPPPPQGNNRKCHFGKRANKNPPTAQAAPAQGQSYQLPIPLPGCGGPQTIVLGYDPVTGQIHQPTGNQTGAGAVPQFGVLAPPCPQPSYQLISPESCYPSPACNVTTPYYFVPA